MGVLKSHIDTQLKHDLNRRLQDARDELYAARFKIEQGERDVPKALDKINDIKALALKYQIEL